MRGNVEEKIERRILTDPHLARLRGAPLKGEVYLVGGAIREMLTGGMPKDYDLVLSDEADLSRFEGYLGAKAFPLGRKPFNMKRITIDGLTFDCTIIEGPIEEDLWRRDFTINAIAYDLRRRRIIDPLLGLEDLKRRLIRCPRRENLRADPLRMLKAVRHLCSLRGFALSDELLRAITEERSLLSGVARERIKYELDRILLSDNVFLGMEVLERTGLLYEIFPELLPMKRMDEEGRLDLEILGHTILGFRYLPRERTFYPFSEGDILWVGYALLFHDMGKCETMKEEPEKGTVHFFYHERVSKEKAKTIMERLRFSTEETRSILSLVENHMRIFLISTDHATVKATRRLVLRMGELTPHLVLLSKCDMYGSSKGRKNSSTERVERRCREIMEVFYEFKKHPPKCVINGHDLLSLGFEEGPIIGRVLKEVLDLQLQGRVRDREDALAYAVRFLKKGNG